MLGKVYILFLSMEHSLWALWYVAWLISFDCGEDMVCYSTVSGTEVASDPSWKFGL